MAAIIFWGKIEFLFREDKSPLVREQAASAIGKMANAASYGLLLTGLRDSDPSVRAVCILSIAYDLKDSGATATIAPMILDQNMDVSHKALKYLEIYGTEEAIPFLEAHKNNHGVQSAINAIRVRSDIRGLTIRGQAPN